MSDAAPYQVLLYYLYCEVECPETYRDEQRKLCESLGLLGRIIVGKEGINGTVSGTVENCAKYMQAMHDDPLSADIEFKIDPEQGHVFPKLSVKARSEIVTLGLGDEDFSPNETTGNYLEPKEWLEAMKDDSFRDLPQWIEDNREQFEGKKILAYCTGGIRCEKLSGHLVRSGFEDVNQLHGGIVKYGKDPDV